MAAVISLPQAKTQLLIKTDDHDEDIEMKLQQASDIIVDYLKGRAHRTATITSSSVASPTVITTATAHGYANGETVIFSGHDDSTPELVGSYVVSNVTEFTFTVPLAVTVAGTGGLATVQWTPATAPKQVQAAALLMLTHLYEHRGEDMMADLSVWQAIERLLMRSRDPALA